MEELLIAPPTTALSDPEPPRLPPRPHHLLQGVLAFLAVVGIGAAITVLLSPPVQVRVITVQRESAPTIDITRPPELHPVERVTGKTPVLLPPAQRPPRRAQLAPRPQKPRPMPSSADCHESRCPTSFTITPRRSRTRSLIRRSTIRFSLSEWLSPMTTPRRAMPTYIATAARLPR